MSKKCKNPDNGGNWIGVGTAIGAAVFAVTNEPVWIAVGVAIGAALGWRKTKNKKEKEMLKELEGRLNNFPRALIIGSL